MLIGLRFKRDNERAAMEKTSKENLNPISISLNYSLYDNFNDWENLTYHNEMIYCTFHLQDHMAQQQILI
jgi:hypothetical protein